MSPGASQFLLTQFPDNRSKFMNVTPHLMPRFIIAVSLLPRERIPILHKNDMPRLRTIPGIHGYMV